jgi:hypothetical protein
MTAPKRLEGSERSKLLHDLSSLRSDNDDAVVQDPKWFLPSEAHARAIRPETLVVRGGRGAGKSALFHFLGHIQRQPELGTSLGGGFPAQTSWYAGYSSAIDHPPLDVVGAFAEGANDDSRRFFWFGWLCRRLAHATEEPLPAGAFADMCRTLDSNWDLPMLAHVTGRELGRLSAWMDNLERSRSGPIVITYDGLDRIKSSSNARRAMTASLLAMWLSLADRYRQIRPKIFVREDLFQASLAAFPDASKLEARSVSLEWRVEDLYRVLIKHMANTSDDLKNWIESSARGIPLQHRGPLGWTPPETLPETGKVSQKGFVDHLAGEQMGSGDKKGLTYRWIPNRLQDAHARAVPRSILNLVRNAAHWAIQHGAKAQNLRLLAPVELVAALDLTSQRRAAELREEFPVVARLEHLRGMAVMLERKVAVAKLSGEPAEDDEYGVDGERVLRTLIELGAMSERPDGRIDVPDIYRYGFGILRKGGVKRAQ